MSKFLKCFGVFFIVAGIIGSIILGDELGHYEFNLYACLIGLLSSALLGCSLYGFGTVIDLLEETRDKMSVLMDCTAKMSETLNRINGSISSTRSASGTSVSKKSESISSASSASGTSVSKKSESISSASSTSNSTADSSSQPQPLPSKVSVPQSPQTSTKNYKICPVCKEMNSSKETVCHQCGWDLSREYNKSYKICPVCKEMNSLKETVCHKCGQQL